jgi:hypothetical protein
VEGGDAVLSADPNDNVGRSIVVSFTFPDTVNLTNDPCANSPPGTGISAAPGTGAYGIWTIRPKLPSRLFHGDLDEVYSRSQSLVTLLDVDHPWGTQEVSYRYHYGPGTPGWQQGSWETTIIWNATVQVL